MDSSLHLVPGRLRLPTAPGVLEEGQSGMGKCSVCVCVLCRHLIYARVCCCVSLCNNKTDGSLNDAKISQSGKGLCRELQSCLLKCVAMCICLNTKKIILNVCVCVCVRERERESV